MRDEYQRYKDFEEGKGSLGPFFPIYKNDTWYFILMGCIINPIMVLACGAYAAIVVGLIFAIPFGILYAIVVGIEYLVRVFK